MHKFDIVCISESYLNSDTSSSDDKLNITGYKMSCADFDVLEIDVRNLDLLWRIFNYWNVKH